MVATDSVILFSPLNLKGDIWKVCTDWLTSDIMWSILIGWWKYGIVILHCDWMAEDSVVTMHSDSDGLYYHHIRRCVDKMPMYNFPCRSKAYLELRGAFHKTCHQWQMTICVISYWNPCFWLVISRFVTDLCYLSLKKGFVKCPPGMGMAIAWILYNSSWIAYPAVDLLFGPVK